MLYRHAEASSWEPHVISNATSLALESMIRGNGGETGIRTLGGLAPTTVFETAPFDHSGTSPRGVAACKPVVGALQPDFHGRSESERRRRLYSSPDQLRGSPFTVNSPSGWPGRPLDYGTLTSTLVMRSKLDIASCLSHFPAPPPSPSPLPGPSPRRHCPPAQRSRPRSRPCSTRWICAGCWRSCT